MLFPEEKCEKLRLGPSIIGRLSNCIWKLSTKSQVSKAQKVNE